MTDAVTSQLAHPTERRLRLAIAPEIADGRQVLTRHWNHRDAGNTKVTKVTDTTVDAVLFLEGISPALEPEVLQRAQRELADRVTPHATSVALHA